MLGFSPAAANQRSYESPFVLRWFIITPVLMLMDGKSFLDFLKTVLKQELDHGFLGKVIETTDLALGFKLAAAFVKLGLFNSVVMRLFRDISEKNILLGFFVAVSHMISLALWMDGNKEGEKNYLSFPPFDAIRIAGQFQLQ